MLTVCVTRFLWVLTTPFITADLIGKGRGRCVAILQADACSCRADRRSLGQQEVEMAASCCYAPPGGMAPARKEQGSMIWRSSGCKPASMRCRDEYVTPTAALRQSLRLPGAQFFCQLLRQCESRWRRAACFAGQCSDRVRRWRSEPVRQERT